ncbi:type VI secretion system ATPase TssH [Agrobacterium sp. NPDC089420]|uniref:type VI secretion system ATPase TssH n=1 Tax=Agrobacterium sp. NPDC089420 TaxID=3363918 RepID=UPI003850240C
MSHIDLNRLVEALEPDLRVALEAAASIAVRMGHRYVDIPHWLLAVVDAGIYAETFEELKIPLPVLQAEIGRSLGEAIIGDGEALSLSQNVLTAGREAWVLASLEAGRNRVTLCDLLLAMDEETSLRSFVRSAFPSLKAMDRAALERLRGTVEDGADADVSSAPASSAPAAGQNDFLRLYTQDMTADARNGKVDPVIGRDDELRQLVDILTRRRQNNPILVGEAGVGKTAVAEALALEIVSGNVPEKLRNVRLLNLDISLLQAGAGVKGEFERRLHGVIDAVKRSAEPIILFIDEAHGLVGAGGAAGQGDAANILKPALARGEVRTVAATTWSEYKKYFEKDAALTRRFQPVHVREPDEATAIRMLRGVADTFVRHHNVTVRDEAIVAAVQLSARYMPARQLPDKAVSLLDTAAAAVSLARQTLPERLRAMESERRLLSDELDWLLREPQDEDMQNRIQSIRDELEKLVSGIDELRGRYDAEMAELAALSQEQSETGASNVSRLRPAGEAQPANIERLVPTVVDRDAIASVVSRWTGIPLGKLLADQIESARTLDDRMRQRVVGQDAAIARIADAMRTARAGLSDPRRPPAVFFLVGMSGTGKTETALSLADLLYGGNSHLTTINMSEFKEEHKVSLLLGSPPGYVGFGEGGVLTEAVRRRPFGVLLLDEIDKAHPGVQDIFYQVFDKGVLRDGEGRDVDFKNTTIFMTANTGSELLSALSADPDTMPEGEALEALLMPELTKQFKPAFLGRTIILPFMPLGTQELSRIVDMQIGKIRERVLATYGADLSLSDAARDALVSRAGASDIGARAIEIMIGKDLLPPLSSFFLEKVIAGERVGKIVVDFDENRFGIRAGAAGETDEFALTEEVGVDKVAASEGATRRMRH